MPVVAVVAAVAAVKVDLNGEAVWDGLYAVVVLILNYVVVWSVGQIGLLGNYLRKLAVVVVAPWIVMVEEAGYSYPQLIDYSS